MKTFEAIVDWIYNLVDTIGNILDVFLDWSLGIQDLYYQFEDEIDIAQE